MMRRLALWDAELRIGGMLGALAILLTTIVALGALSLARPDLAFALTEVLVIATALAFPRLGLALLVMITPIQGLWGLSRDDTPLLLGSLMAAVNLRHLGLWLEPLRQPPWRHLPPLLLVLAAFMLLFVIWSLFSLPAMSPEQTKTTLMGCAFVILLFGAALAVFHHCDGDNGNTMRLGLIGAVFLALALTVAFDVVAVYFPGLSNRLRLLSEWPGLRLSGLHANPNATAKYLLAGLMFAIAATWRLGHHDTPARAAAPTALAWGPLLTALGIAVTCAIAIGATSSKSSLIAAVIAPLAAAVAFWPLSKRAVVTAAASSVAIAVLVLGYNMVLASGLATWTARQHFAVDRITPPAALDKRESNGLSERLRAQMRVARSHEMFLKTPSKDAPQAHSQIFRNIDGDIEYTERKCKSLICTGQRDRLWTTGLAIWADHWLIGIGPTHWTEEYLRRAKFPFDSPHNILIEMGAGLGVVGLLLYGTFLVVMWRQWRTTFSQPQDDATLAIYNRGTVLFAIALMASEWVDPAKFFALNPHALWVWLLLAGTLQAHAATPPRAGRPAAAGAEEP